MAQATSLIELSNKQLLAQAPSIFATKPWDGVSKRYAFIPTLHVVDAMRDNGFVPVRAEQSRCRVAGKKAFTKHMLRFRHKDDAKMSVAGVPDESRAHGGTHRFLKKGTEPSFAEIVLVNAHDRSAAYSLYAGIFEMICSNGLVIQSSNFDGIHIQHSGNVVDEVIAGTKAIVERVPEIRNQMAAWRAVPLSPKQRLTLAEAVLIHRYGMDDADNLLSPIRPESILVPRREQDDANNLWKTANVVQENLMRGGVEGRSATGRRTRTRSVASVNTELELNKAVWACAEVMADRIGAAA